MELITLEQYKGTFELAPEQEANAKDLLCKVNSLLQELKVSSIVVTSGFRSPEHNLKIGGSPKSKHCSGQAIDLADNDRAIGDKIMTNLRLLVSRGMAMESLPYCRTSKGGAWVHLQNCLPPSEKTVFLPYSGSPVLR